MTTDPVETLKRVKEQLGEAIHASIRKNGNSLHASTAWRAINDMSGEEWGAILNSVIEGLGIDDAIKASDAKWHPAHGSD